MNITKKQQIHRYRKQRGGYQKGEGIEGQESKRHGFPGGSDGKESACNAGDLVQSLDWEDPLEEGMATNSNILV